MPRPVTILNCLDATTRKRLDEALLSNAKVDVSEVYRRFGLSERGVEQRGFYAYARRLRARFAKKSATATQPTQATGKRPRAMETLDRLMQLMNDRIDAGDPKHMPGLASAMRAMTDCMRLTLEEQAEARAAELHAAKMAELQKRLDAEKAAADSKLDRMAIEKGIPVDLAERIKDLYGVKVA